MLELEQAQGLVEVPEQVCGVFQADAEADKIGGDACVELFLGRELGMGGAGGVDGQALRIANVGQVAEKF